MGWRRGDVIVHREVWRGRPWQASPVVVVEDTPAGLVTYPRRRRSRSLRAPTGVRTPGPRSGPGKGTACSSSAGPGEAYSVWHFWSGAERRFAGWYLNLEEPFRRTAVGYDTQDLELDVWIPVDGRWRFKDEEQLAERVRDGRYTEAQVAATRALGDEIGAMLDRGEHWWDDRWTAFEPDPSWRAPTFPPGWEDAPVPPEPPPDAYRVLGV